MKIFLPNEMPNHLEDAFPVVIGGNIDSVGIGGGSGSVSLDDDAYTVGVIVAMIQTDFRYQNQSF